MFGGLDPDGYVLVNTVAQFAELGLGEFAGGFRPRRALTVPATDLAREHLGRPLPSAALLGALAALTRRRLARSRSRRRSASGSPARVGEGNVAAARGRATTLGARSRVHA